MARKNGQNLTFFTCLSVLLHNWPPLSVANDSKYWSFLEFSPLFLNFSNFFSISAFYSLYGPKGVYRVCVVGEREERKGKWAMLDADWSRPIEINMSTTGSLSLQCSHGTHGNEPLRWKTSPDFARIFKIRRKNVKMDFLITKTLKNWENYEITKIQSLD